MDTLRDKKLLEDLWERWPDEQRFGVNLLKCYLALEWIDQARVTLDRIIERRTRPTSHTTGTGGRTTSSSTRSKEVLPAVATRRSMI